MEEKNQVPFSEERIAKNPAVNLKLVNEAHRVRKELEKLGVWEDHGSRVRSPFEPNPTLQPHEQRIEQLISQDIESTY